MQDRILLLRVVDVADKATHLEPAAAQAHQICVDGSHALDWSAPYTVGRARLAAELDVDTCSLLSLGHAHSFELEGSGASMLVVGQS